MSVLKYHYNIKNGIQGTRMDIENVEVVSEKMPPCR